MEKMLCDELIEGIKNLGNISACDDDTFRHTLEIVNSVLKSPNTPKLKDSTHVQGQMTSAMLALLTETCRHGMDSSHLESYLKNYDYSNKRIEMVLKLYEHVKAIVTTELDSIGVHFPQIVGADWSLSYCVKDSSSERVNTLQYLVDLQTQGTGGQEGLVQFACSVEEMQDLTTQLKEAAKHVEKLSSG